MSNKQFVKDSIKALAQDPYVREKYPKVVLDALVALGKTEGMFVERKQVSINLQRAVAELEPSKLKEIAAAEIIDAEAREVEK